jgi:hypothetical protein
MALENAVSVAHTLLTEATMTGIEEPAHSEPAML